MAFSSGEFWPRIDLNPLGRAAAIYNNQLWFIGATNAQNGFVRQTTFSLAGNIETDYTQGWTTTNSTMSGVKYRGQGQPGPSTFAKCAATPAPSGLYLFWNELPYNPVEPPGWADLVASRYAPDEHLQYGWGDSIQLLWPQSTQGITTDTLVQGNTMPQPWRGADVSATYFGSDASGDDTFIVATTCIIPPYDHHQLLFSVYNTGDIDTNKGVWAPKSIAIVDAKNRPQSNIPYAVTDVGRTVSIDWFSAGPTQSGDAPPSLYLAVVAGVDVAQTGVQSVFLMFYIPISVDSSKIPSLGEPLRFNEGWSTPAPGPEVLRDPGGRLSLYQSIPENRQIQQIIYSTAGAPGPSGNPGEYLQQGDCLLSPSIVTLPAASADDAPIAPIYFLQGVQANGLPPEATSYPVYEFLFYNGDPRCQIRQYGTLRVLPNYWQGPPQPQQGQTKYTIYGIIDGPIPFPNENLGGDPADPEPNAYVGDVIYSHDGTQSVAHTSSFNWTVGFESSGQTTKGIGPAFDLAFNGGMGNVTGSGSSTTSFEAKVGSSKVDETGLKVVPYGTLFAVQATIYATAYQFLDASGAAVVDPTSSDPGQAPKCITLTVGYQGGSSDPGYLPYAVTPGDVTTYTPESWNARMAALGYSWPNPDPRWSNDVVNYFRDVIVPNAYVFTINEKGGPSIPQEYIECEWGQASTGEISFGQASTNFVENSWQLTNKDYVGVSGGFDVKDPVFGILGEAAQYQFLVGTTESWNTTDTSTSGAQWGVALTGPTGNPAEWGPPTRSLEEAPTAMQYYTFRIYLLPPPTPASGLPANQWAQELIQYLPASYPPNIVGPEEIDSGSQPWRIIFVVTEYMSNDGTKSYSYGRQWDRGSGMSA